MANKTDVLCLNSKVYTEELSVPAICLAMSNMPPDEMLV